MVLMIGTISTGYSGDGNTNVSSANRFCYIFVTVVCAETCIETYCNDLYSFKGFIAIAIAFSL